MAINLKARINLRMDGKIQRKAAVFADVVLLAVDCSTYSGRSAYPGQLKIRIDKTASETNISDVKMWYTNPSRSNKRKMYSNRIRKYLNQIK